MSGHSKWATIKHKKGAADKARGKLFAKIARQIEVAAKAGGGDIDANPTLRTAVAKARAARMTNDAVDRAIKRGTGEAGAETYESITYEGYAPGGVALLIDVLTDNRNRTGAEVRAIFSKMGGSMAEPGAVGWQFSRRGVVLVDGGADEEALMMAGFSVESADMPMVSDNAVPVTSVDDARKVLRIIEAMEDNDDVQDVYSNFDIADDVMEAAAG
jgi:YebC/PmpR family DNA-binding regulatory protein